MTEVESQTPVNIDPSANNDVTVDIDVAADIDLEGDWKLAVEAAASRKAEDPVVLHIGAISSFTDYFVLLTGANQRQTQAIADAIERDLRDKALRPLGVEGRQAGEWILMDYGDFLVHIFSPEKRAFYDLERLWKAAPRVPLPAAA